MNYKTHTAVVHEGQPLHKRSKVYDDFQKLNIIEDDENIVIKNDTAGGKGMIFGLIFSIPIWILIIGFIIWVFP